GAARRAGGDARRVGPEAPGPRRVAVDPPPPGQALRRLGGRAAPDRAGKILKPDVGNGAPAFDAWVKGRPGRTPPATTRRYDDAFHGDGQGHGGLRDRRDADRAGAA